MGVAHFSTLRALMNHLGVIADRRRALLRQAEMCQKLRTRNTMMDRH